MVPIPDSTLLVTAALFAQSEKQQEDNRRLHLGASEIGEECDRKLWFSFRWAQQRKRDGRMIRLLQRGKDEEAKMIADLRALGYELRGCETRISGSDGHFGGTLDGVLRGIPAAPATWHVLELKTANDKNWRELCKHGVQQAMPVHYAQVQVYMHGARLDRALYLAVNKNDDSIYEERIPLDQVFAQRMFDRADRIIRRQTTPERISDDPAWYQCKMCHFHPICHEEVLPERPCRTCLHSALGLEGRWLCHKHQVALDEKDQKAGCPDHRFLPSLLDWLEQTDATDEDVVYRAKDGTEWRDQGP